MSRKRHKPEEIVTKLRQVEVLTAWADGCGGDPVNWGDGVTFYRWRQEYSAEG